MSKNPSSKQSFLLRSLNLYGLDHLDPIILASLTDGQPLLLIGRHGTAKSELLNRLASALGLRHRHYNASLIAFDDLLGFPVPNPEKNALTYLRTDGDLWDAESVFLDEISRCRPEHQNKLFSIIHERRVQGLLLDKLRYRWSAMNPPISLEGLEEHEDAYQGSLPLDPALADRFPYIVEIPDFNDMNAACRRSIISKGGCADVDGASIQGWIDSASAQRKNISSQESEWIGDYVNALVLPLKKAGWPISGRRAVVLSKTIASIHAACLALNWKDSLKDTAFIALKWGLPQRVKGERITVSKLNSIHKAALQAAGQPQDSPLLKIQAESNPVKRIALALQVSKSAIPRIEFSQLVTDAYAGLSVPERYLLSRQLLPILATKDRVTASTYELLSKPLLKLKQFTEQGTHNLSVHRNRASEWDRLVRKVSRVSKSNAYNTPQLCNILYTLFTVENENFDPTLLVKTDRLWHGWLHPGEPCKEAA